MDTQGKSEASISDDLQSVIERLLKFRESEGVTTSELRWIADAVEEALYDAGWTTTVTIRGEKRQA